LISPAPHLLHLLCESAISTRAIQSSRRLSAIRRCWSWSAEGYSLLLGAIHPPLTSIRHAHAARLKAPVHYAPPPPVLKLWEERAREDFRWPDKLIAEHERKYGAAFKPALRARNASYFAYLFAREGIRHFHVHFANRAAHTALFLKEMVGIPFSVTAHGQDFMSDLGSDELLREICRAAEFVAVETDYSRGLLSGKCPEAITKIHRVYNGMEFSNFITAEPSADTSEAVRIVSIGRLVEFKGFEHLVAACALLKARASASRARLSATVRCGRVCRRRSQRPGSTTS
jgi:glycosyltransferase involved in cell wall biosynthesis